MKAQRGAAGRDQNRGSYCRKAQCRGGHGRRVCACREGVRVHHKGWEGGRVGVGRAEPRAGRISAVGPAEQEVVGTGESGSSSQRGACSRWVGQCFNLTRWGCQRNALQCWGSHPPRRKDQNSVPQSPESLFPPTGPAAPPETFGTQVTAPREPAPAMTRWRGGQREAQPRL